MNIRIFRQMVFTLTGAMLCVALVLTIAKMAPFRDQFVMVTVEESSTSALVSWPLLMERTPGVFLDCQEKTISIDKKPNLLGVSLVVHCSLSSQGIEFSDSMSFSRLGRAKIDLRKPVRISTQGLDGNTVEMIDNSARITRGTLSIEKTSSDGTIVVKYGDERFQLKPGKSFAELRAKTPEGEKVIDAANWDNEFHESVESGYPVTRLVIVNRGFWPKAGVKEATDFGQGVLQSALA